MNLLVIVFLVCFFFIPAVPKGLHEEFSWTRLDYDWPVGQSRSYIPNDAYKPVVFHGNTKGTTRRPGSLRPSSTPRPSGSNNISYIYQNNIPMGANIWRNKLFITVPRRRLGVPSSLNFVWVNDTQRENVPLIPYPDWQTNILGSSGSGGHNFVSVYRVAVDPCDRLWFIDTGRLELPDDPQQVQPPALVIMDLKTDRILQYHVFNSSHLRPTTNLASVTVDVTKDQCDDAFAYIPDLGGYGLIVYSLKDDSSWRVTHNYFFLEPLAGEFTIGGHSFQWNDGIFSVALTGVKPDGYRDAYFHSMAGFNQYRVSTRILRNETLATRSHHGSDFQLIGHRGERSQSSASDLDKTRGILFLGLVNQNALACWNINSPLQDISVVHKDNKRMIYPSDVKVSGDDVIVLTNTMPVFLYGTLDYDQVNFRVWVENIDMAIKKTKCERSHGTKY